MYYVIDKSYIYNLLIQSYPTKNTQIIDKKANNQNTNNCIFFSTLTEYYHSVKP